MRDILVHLDGTAEDDVRLGHAEAMAARFPGSRILGAYTNFLPEYAYSLTGLVGGGAIAELAKLEERLRREGDGIFDALRERFTRIGATHEVRKLDAQSTRMAASVASLARWSDVFIATTPYRVPMSAWDGVVEAVLFSGGRGLYLVPPGCPVRQDLRSVLFAWQDTREAARAASEAMPLLQRASRVRLLHVNAEENASDAEEVCEAAAFFARHGIVVEAAAATADGYRVAGTILAEADAMAADVIVMGAYGHSRFKEWMLGGVTRDILERSRLPLLIAH